MVVRDVCWDAAGTSTGAILAAYLATKGANCNSILKDRYYQERIDNFEENRRTEQGVPGTALNRGRNVDAGVGCALY
jgi:hypothetical protein